MNNGILHNFKLPRNTALIVGHIPTITKNVSEKMLSQYQVGHSFERALQLATADALVRNHFDAPTEIHRNEDGKPRFPQRSEHLSISHTGEYMAVIIGDNPVAVDIEITGRTIERIYHRFTRDLEFAKIDAELSSDSLLTLWGIKECLFKIIPHQGILFREHLLLHSCDKKNGVLKAACSVSHPKLHKEFVVNSFIFEPLVISYIIEDEV
ncbi:MAG: 4'-phosphopantetheinyl transferase superfamily protein [Flavobacteriales bacterium]|jgi:phosphopantetheinyl transferase|nr:4'-phosphopantetheinyl transferase superfamily protein [Flavobacteriales bacterium]MBT3964835.1 4'-phosphopantetheinyl transferase superfamily protein [Flavobacteriales bacterium]MBT4705304.1 4'-phosphopantetheinyl transferase superfamily protein [Flavobacteriales bacterium]MBT4930870.1 4'-phosphopantetheinyl transferase superfamily protein [Flavobacteriales bacterium]MBT5132792.1 4'-phosphopantetheinyl transferase superfamily protein [Flavobacteriales bacterium]